MGGLPGYLPGYASVADASARERLANLWGLEHLPDKPGLTVVEMMNAILGGKIKGMYIVGENPIVSDPNTHHVKEALDKVDLLIVQDIFLTETAELADIVLPAASWLEKDGTVTGTERRVQSMSKAIEPIDQARADWQIVSEVANRLNLGFDYSRPEEVLQEIDRAVPSYGGITPERIKSLVGGLVWPCPTPDHPGTPILHRETFNTPDGLGRFTPVDYQPPAELPDDEYPLLLTTGRVVMHYNAGTMTRRSASLLRRSPELFIEVNPTDAERLGIASGEEVTVVTRRGDTTAKASISKNTAAGTVFMPFHFPGTNVLTVDALDAKAKIPELKVAACKVVKRS
jgi:predicted molibdopterin-dependent oxidoreductase YjgC